MFLHFTMGPMSIDLLQFMIMVFLLATSSANANKIHCSVSADIREFERYYGAIREMLHDNDPITDVRLLKTNELKRIQPSERCCFLLRLGNFYMSNVFPEVESSSIQQHQDFKHLANSILSLSKSLKECHTNLRCLCGVQSHTFMKNFKDEYFKMETKDAAIKAVGELNILFHWMEKNYLS